MERIESLPQPQCWVDVYEASHFNGRMRRHVGPKKLRQISGKSVIVGPDAKVVLKVRRGSRDVVVTLQASKVIPDLAAAVRRAEIRGAEIVGRA